MASPTQRSLERWRKAGYEVDVVERYIPGARKKRDLFGMFDIIAIGNGEVVLLQVTTGSHVADRLKKCRDNSKAFVRWSCQGAGVRMLVEGWRFSKKENKWICRQEEI